MLCRNGKRRPCFFPRHRLPAVGIDIHGTGRFPRFRYPGRLHDVRLPVRPDSARINTPEITRLILTVGMGRHKNDTVCSLKEVVSRRDPARTGLLQHHRLQAGAPRKRSIFYSDNGGWNGNLPDDGISRKHGRRECRHRYPVVFMRKCQALPGFPLRSQSRDPPRAFPFFKDKAVRVLHTACAGFKCLRCRRLRDGDRDIPRDAQGFFQLSGHACRIDLGASRIEMEIGIKKPAAVQNTVFSLPQNRENQLRLQPFRIRGYTLHFLFSDRFPVHGAEAVIHARAPVHAFARKRIHVPDKRSRHILRIKTDRHVGIHSIRHDIGLPPVSQHISPPVQMAACIDAVPLRCITVHPERKLFRTKRQCLTEERTPSFGVDAQQQSRCTVCCLPHGPRAEKAGQRLPVLFRRENHNITRADILQGQVHHRDCAEACIQPVIDHRVFREFLFQPFAPLSKGRAGPAHGNDALLFRRPAEERTFVLQGRQIGFAVLCRKHQQDPHKQQHQGQKG